MKIKKYEATTEQEAILKIKDELGMDAVILSIKKTQPKGIFKFFRKPNVEVTAAYEENPKENKDKEDTYKQEIPKQQISNEQTFNEQISDINDKPDLQTQSIPQITNQDENKAEIKNETKIEDKSEMENLQKKIENLESILSNMSSKLDNYKFNGNEKYKNKIIQVAYDNLVSNDVMPEIIDKLLDGLGDLDNLNDDEVNYTIKTIYDRIVEIIGKPKPIVIDERKPKIIAVMGPTGVGKTTTIAKLSSFFMLNQHKHVSLITADTYRIAAVDQLKIYADILGIQTEVLYSVEDVDDTFKKLSYSDIIFVDTAGRSHKNSEQFNELNLLLQQMNNSEKYLVLSMTTKFSDLKNIVETYSKIADYNIIFTKCDETLTKGSILNIRYLTGKSLSYITNGQDVPDDIEIINPSEIAKTLLGSIDG